MTETGIDWSKDFTILGVRKSLAAWLKDPTCRVGREEFAERIAAGWSITRAILVPGKRPKVKPPKPAGKAKGKRAAHGTGSTFRGVTRRKDGRYVAQIKVDGKVLYLGDFDDDREAAQAYDAKVDELGLMRRKNFDR